MMHSVSVGVPIPTPTTSKNNESSSPASPLLPVARAGRERQSQVNFLVLVILLMSLVAFFSTSSFTASKAPLVDKDTFSMMPKKPSANSHSVRLEQNDGCPYPRVRRDWNDISPSERKLYLDAYWILKKRGTVDLFVNCHMIAGVHNSPDWLPWHRYFTTEFEGRIRALGGKYKCFTLPYWDWTRMAGKPVGSNPLWKQGFGGNGDLNSAIFNCEWPNIDSRICGGCVMDGRFGLNTGFTTNLGDCLRREFAEGNWYVTTERMLALINNQTMYKYFEHLFGHWHNNAHGSIGGYLGMSLVSVNEPIWFLLHSYVDLVWGMRSDCHGYDTLKNWRTDPRVFIPEDLYLQDCYPLIDDEKWSYAHYHTINPAAVMNLRKWGITYDVSDMLSRTGMEMKNCKFTWFLGTERRSAVPQRVSDEVMVKRACMKAYKECQYKEPLQGCDKELDDSKITIDVILNRPGVKGNSCLVQWRRVRFNDAKQRGKLRALCDGEMDPIC